MNENAAIDKVEQILQSVAALPGVRIERDAFLRSALKNRFPKDVVEKAIKTSPAQAGIKPSRLRPIAQQTIGFECNKATALSALTGIPGGAALAASIPADLAQYNAHAMRVAQKLAYLYGWEDLFADDDALDEETRNLLILFLGVMFGAQGATEAIRKVALQASEAFAKHLARQSLTHGVVYPAVKQVAKTLGYRMTVPIFSKGVSKVIPVVGAVASGTLTYFSFQQMSQRLGDHLATLSLADPRFYADAAADANAGEVDGDGGSEGWSEPHLEEIFITIEEQPQPEEQPEPEREQEPNVGSEEGARSDTGQDNA